MNTPTSPVGAARVLARRMGWLLYEGEDARNVPVYSRHGWCLLTDDGSALPTTPAAEEAA